MFILAFIACELLNYSQCYDFHSRSIALKFTRENHYCFAEKLSHSLATQKDGWILITKFCMFVQLVTSGLFIVFIKHGKVCFF